MDVIIPDTSAFSDPTVDERLDIYESFDPCAAQGIRGELWTLRAEVERLTAERDAFARRMRVVEMGVGVIFHAAHGPRVDGPHRADHWHISNCTRSASRVHEAVEDSAYANGIYVAFPTAAAALDAAADALEAAGLMEVPDA